MPERMTEQMQALTDIADVHRRQIACLTGFIGTLLGALQAKQMLHEDDIEILVEIFEEISPDSRARPIQTILNAVRVTAEETPHLMEVTATENGASPHLQHVGGTAEHESMV